MKHSIAVLLILGLAACSETGTMSAHRAPAPAEIAKPQTTEPASGGVAWSHETPPSQPLAKTEGRLIEMSARVAAISLKKREVTLRGPDGTQATFAVDPAVTRLNEVRVGDHVVVQYLESLAFEVREPTPEEKKNSKRVMDIAGKSPAHELPGAGMAREIRAIVTIEAIDKKGNTVTIKGPEGRLVIIEAQNPANLDRVKVGDTVAVTYTAALAVGLQRVD